MIGIIGYGMVGQAVAHGFVPARQVISDPKHNFLTVEDLVNMKPDALFVCVPTPANDFTELHRVLDQIKELKYPGLTIVKSTALSEELEGYDIVYNPEFLSRGTHLEDFVNPPYVILGGARAKEALKFYEHWSVINLDRVHITDIRTAAFIKYTMNTFYALKVTFMNEMYDVAAQMSADYDQAAGILATHPWMGSHHFHVPGPDGKRGFGGPCLPKDTQTLADRYHVDLLQKVIEINGKYR